MTPNITLIASLAPVLLWTGVGTAQAQQSFETRHVLAPPSQTELAPLPGIFILPVGAAPLDPDVAVQLSEAIQAEVAAAQDSRFEVRTRPSTSGQTSWTFVVRNAPRAAHDVLTQQFTGQLIDCLHSLDDDLNLAAIFVLLQGGFLDDPLDRGRALTAGTQMLASWQTDRCATRQNDLPLDRDPTLTGATRGMLTGGFDPLLFRGQGLLDLIAALTPLYLHAGGFWAVEMTPRLEALFRGGVANGLLTTAQAGELENVEQQTFWDWAVLAISTKAGLARSFVQRAATGCVTTVPDLRRPFQLSSCTSAGRLQLVTLSVNGQDYTTVQRRP